MTPDNHRFLLMYRLFLLAQRKLDQMWRQPDLLARALGIAGVCLVGAAVAGSLLQMPNSTVLAASKGDKTAGAALFHQSGCEYCHGADGRGTERGPDLGTVGARLTRQRIERQIREGGKAMPAFGDALQPDQIQDLVAFLHEKRSAPKKSKEKSPAIPASKESE